MPLMAQKKCKNQPDSLKQVSKYLSPNADNHYHFQTEVILYIADKPLPIRVHKHRIKHSTRLSDTCKIPALEKRVW